MRFAQSFLPATLLGTGVLLISGMRQQFEVRPREPLSRVEMPHGGLIAKDIEIAEDERKVAGMTEYVLREYRKEDRVVTSLYVGYYDRQVQGKSIHSPKNCLPGAGWEVLENDQVELPSASGPLALNRVLLSNKGVQALVFYWYQGRGRIVASEYVVKANLLVDAARYGRTEEALVRLVLPLRGERGDTTAFTEDQADRFARSVAPIVAEQVNSVLPSPPGGT